MLITLEKIIDGSKLHIHSADSKLDEGKHYISRWIDEYGNQITDQAKIKILEAAEIGKELGSLLYETRYKIIAIDHSVD